MAADDGAGSLHGVLPIQWTGPSSPPLSGYATRSASSQRRARVLVAPEVKAIALRSSGSVVEPCGQQARQVAEPSATCASVASFRLYRACQHRRSWPPRGPGPVVVVCKPHVVVVDLYSAAADAARRRSLVLDCAIDGRIHWRPRERRPASRVRATAAWSARGWRAARLSSPHELLKSHSTPRLTPKRRIAP